MLGGEAVESDQGLQEAPDRIGRAGNRSSQHSGTVETILERHVVLT